MHRFRVWVGIILSCRLNPKIGALRVWAKLGDTENVLRPNLHTNLFAFWCNPTGSQSWTLALGQKMKTFESDLFHIDFRQCYRKSETSSRRRLGCRTIKRRNLTWPLLVHHFWVWVGTVFSCQLKPESGALRVWAKLGDTENDLQPNLQRELVSLFLSHCRKSTLPKSDLKPGPEP